MTPCVSTNSLLSISSLQNQLIQLPLSSSSDQNSLAHSHNSSTPPMMATPTTDELVQAHADLWCHTFAYLKSMALQSAIKLGIPTAIHRCGGAASLSDLQAAPLPVPASKWPCVSRLMKLLAVSGIFKEGEPGAYCLTWCHAPPRGRRRRRRRRRR